MDKEQLLTQEDIILSKMEDLQSHIKEILINPLEETTYLIDQCIDEVESITNTIVKSFSILKNGINYRTS